jgi:hypothetical protein
MLPVEEGDVAAPITPTRHKSPKEEGQDICQKKDDGAC